MVVINVKLSVSARRKLWERVGRRVVVVVTRGRVGGVVCGGYISVVVSRGGGWVEGVSYYSGV